MSKTLGEIDYNEDARLIKSREDRTLKPEIVILEGIEGGGPEDEKTEDPSQIDADEVQARYIARRIREMVNRSDGDEQIRYGDIGVLYRGINRRAKTVMRVFSEEGIPVIFDGDSEQVEAQEISLFLKLLNLIDNHKQDLPLLAMMHLPIFDFTLDDEVQIRSLYPDMPYYYQAAEAYRDEQNDSLALKLRAFYSRLSNWRELSKHLDLEDFLWRLLLDSGFYDYVGNLAGGKERKHNLRLLLERAVSYKNSSLKGLPSFLQFVSRLQKRGQVISSSAVGANSEDAVHLMSIHKSKGLEFPVVFLADTGRKFNVSKTSDLIYHKDFGYGARHLKMEENVLVKNTTLLLEAIAEKHRQEEYSEEMRLLYVAMTRAMNRLIIVGMVNDMEKSSSIWSGGTEPVTLLKQKTFMDWIMSALNMHETTPRADKERGFETPEWIVSLESALDYTVAAEEEDLGEELEDESYHSLRERIFEKLSEPEKPQAFTRPVKMSVSRIKRSGIAEEEPEELTAITPAQKSAADPAALGTAVHSFLQHLDFESYLGSENKAEELNKQKQTLVQQGFIEAQYEDLIDNSIISDFLESNLGSRLLTAYSKSEGSVLKEMPFSFDMSPDSITEVQNLGERMIQISGVIDCCFFEDNKWILIDYKTDRFYTPAIKKQRIDEYSLQIGLYARALEQLTGIPVGEKHIYFLTENLDYEAA